MENFEAINKLLVKWRSKFLDPDIQPEDLLDSSFGDDLRDLGFKMDCGQGFCGQYGREAFAYEGLKEVLEEIDDLALLGAGIFSQWRYFQHWAYEPESILQEENRMWFVLALDRLSLLARRDSFIFQGSVKKIRLVSNSICFETMPDPEDEVVQSLLIHSDGRVYFSAYTFGQGGGVYKPGRKDRFKIQETTAKSLLSALGAYFGKAYGKLLVTDIGTWDISLTDSLGKTYSYRGSLSRDFDDQLADLSDRVRDSLGRDDLYVFDGEGRICR
ncbi:hypothetical protein [Urinicoccus massiliensis]|uniref:hypothetical protein n=1 Tax=Urinicoccus massiliensis TaxID=1723382 RepID=UPI000931D61A|nr:hypothetical protein [Urinicoccus massiliensis]